MSAEQKPPVPQEPARYSWAEVWTAVLTRPNQNTYHELLDDPQATPRRAYIWVYLSSMLTAVVATLVILNSAEFAAALSQTELGMVDPSSLTGTLLMSILCTAPFASGIALLIFMGLVFVIQFIADQIGPREQTQGRLPQITYVVAAIWVPVNLVSLIFLILPAFSLLGIVMTIYQVVLLVIATRAVYHFDLGKGMTASLIPLAGLFLMVFFFTGGGL